MKRGTISLKSSRESYYKNHIKRNIDEPSKSFIINLDDVEVIDNNITLVHLVLYSDSFAYNEMMNISREFYKNNESNIKTIYYCYDSSLNVPYEYNENEMTLKFRGKETYLPGILNKTLDAFTFALRVFPNTRRIIRTNISTIINLKTMFNENIEECDYGGYFVGDLAWIDKYSGVVDRRWFGTTYAFGTCIILSRRVLEEMIRHRSKFRMDLIDDLSIGVWMKENMPDIPIWSSKYSKRLNPYSYDIDSVSSNSNMWFYAHRNKKNRPSDIKNMKVLVKYLTQI